MQTLEQTNQGAAGIYWLAYLLTGRREPSLDVAIEAAEFQDGAGPFFSNPSPFFSNPSPFFSNPSPFFSEWMLAWSRRVVIAKALAAIGDELADSARRMASKRFKKPVLPPRNWAQDGDTTKIELERALLAIDLFPRCALLLVVFERVTLEDAAILLNAGRDLVRRAQTIGSQELTRNLARARGWTSKATKTYVINSEMQHA